MVYSKCVFAKRFVWQLGTTLLFIVLMHVHLLNQHLSLSIRTRCRFLCERACSECLNNFVAYCCGTIVCGHRYVIILPHLDWRNSYSTRIWKLQFEFIQVALDTTEGTENERLCVALYFFLHSQLAQQCLLLKAI